jgi:hypothetical protein
MMRILITTALLLAAAVSAGADPYAMALHRLAQAKTFAFGRIGRAAVISQGEKDYRVVLAGASPLAAFEKVFSTGTPEAKAYALVAIRKLDYNRFKTLADTVRDSKSEVDVTQGCERGPWSWALVVKDIDSGAYSR